MTNRERDDKILALERRLELAEAKFDTFISLLRSASQIPQDKAPASGEPRGKSRRKGPFLRIPEEEQGDN